MTNYISLAQAKTNLKGDVIIGVVSIGDLKAGSGSKGDWTKKDAIVKDMSGDQKLTLWNEDIKKIEVGKFYKLENPYWTVYEGNPQLSLGQYCKIVECKNEDLLPRQDGFAEAETKTAELKAPQSDEQQKANLTKAESMLGDHLKKYDDKIKVTWALEQVAIDRLIMLDGKVPDPAKVGMYIKLLDDA